MRLKGYIKQMHIGNRFGLLCLFLLGGILIGCTGGEQTMPMEKTDEALVIYCPHPLKFINPIILEFESRTGIPVVVKTGGTGELLAQVESLEEPRCDVFWGGSLSTIRGKKELFEPYISQQESMIQQEFKNTEGNITRFTNVPSVLMVNENLIGEIPLKGYKDLLNPELKGKIGMSDPSKSSSAYEHLINMLYAMGEGNPEAGWDYIDAFCENLDGNLLDSSSQVYQGVGEGRYTVGLTFEEGGAHYVASGEAVKLVYMEEGVISKADVVCILKGTQRLDQAKAFVDFVIGKDAQTMICTNLGRRSVRIDVEEPNYLPDQTEIPMIYDEEMLVNDKKQEWIHQFLERYESVQ